MRSVTKGYRRTRWAAAATIAACAVTVFATGSPASGQSSDTSPLPGAVKPGRGLALAETEKVDPRAGSLSLGITGGRSIAGHQNTVAQASSQAYDYGVIGTTLAGKSCTGGDPTLSADKQPSAMQVDSRQANNSQDADEDKVPVPAHKHASANPTPFGEAVTTIAPQPVGPIQIGGGISRAHSGLMDDGKTREASATVDIDGISIPVAGVSLSSLHWEATWRSTDPDNGVIGTFSIGSANLGSQALPTNDPTQVLVQLNGALAALGFAITPPQAHKAGDTIIVDPMGIKVFPSTTRDALPGAIIGGAQPVRQDAFDAILAQTCSFASGITIFDIIVGSITGAGSFSVVLGGAQASSGDAYQNSFCLGCGSNSSLSNTVTNLPVVSTAGTSGTTTGGGATYKGGTDPGPATGTPAAAVAPAGATGVLGKRGGALAGVGLAGLGLMAAMAEGDRRKMRRAQREIPQFEE